MMEDHGSNNLLVRMATQGTTMNIFSMMLNSQKHLLVYNLGLGDIDLAYHQPLPSLRCSHSRTSYRLSTSRKPAQASGKRRIRNTMLLICYSIYHLCPYIYIVCSSFMLSMASTSFCMDKQTTNQMRQRQDSIIKPRQVTLGPLGHHPNVILGYMGNHHAITE